MQRRKFLIRSSQFGMSVAASSLLVGCGGSSSSDIVSTAVPTEGKDVVSVIDEKIVVIDAKQAEITTIHTKMQNNLNFSNTDLNNFYAKTVPNSSEDHVFPENYLSSVDENLWKNAKAAHQIAYDQYNHQLTKLKASLRLFDHQNNNAKEVSQQAKATGTAVNSESISASDPLNELIKLLENLSVNNFGTTAFAIIEASLVLIYNNLKGYIENGEAQALDYAYLTYKAIEALLSLIKEKTLSDLSFDSSNEILKSLAKITVATISVLALASLRTLNIAKEELSSEQQATQAFLASNSLDNSVSSVWMGVSSKIALGSINALKENLNTSIQTNTIPDNTELSKNLKSKSEILAITSVTIKELFAKIANDGVGSLESAFTEGSTADTFKILFASDKNPYDEALTQTIYEKQTEFQTYEPSLSSTPLPAFKITTSSEARAATTDVESDAYLFAKELSSVSYSFASDTESDASDFATHMADMAYAFVMDIEEDAYQFAMQGMEYGYLFASQGEDVGVMADRILWMAVQIGVMADRIGEMGDRIVYTEQLIVYTEILILDFGILIYNFGSQISNTMLTGLALIFDREWYTPASNDAVNESINSNAMMMMEHMHEYAIATLNHQNELRELTREGLDSFALPEVEVEVEEV